jgi:predicted nucleic acid-binding protein
MRKLPVHPVAPNVGIKISMDGKGKTKSFDALHLACAESVFAEVLLTTDDKFLKKAKKNKSVLKVRVENPVTWLMEVTQSAGTNDES